MIGTEALVERLRAMRDSGQRTPGGGTVGYGPDGKLKMATTWGGEPIMVRTNPDGPEAAALIEAQATELAALRAQVGAMNAALEPLARHDSDPFTAPRHITSAHVKAARAAIRAPPVEGCPVVRENEHG